MDTHIQETISINIHNTLALIKHKADNTFFECLIDKIYNIEKDFLIKSTDDIVLKLLSITHKDIRNDLLDYAKDKYGYVQLIQW